MLETGEIEEMVEIYQEKGFSEEDARKVVGIMARHKDFFLDHMMVEVRKQIMYMCAFS